MPYRIQGHWVFCTRAFGGMIFVAQPTLWALLTRIPNAIRLHLKHS
jgi:hypothetical protein